MSIFIKNKKPVLLFKYGGNAMLNDQLQQKVLQQICSLKEEGYDVIIVHGGGPFIKQALRDAQIESEFIDGHRKTTAESLEYVEMALKGKVNGQLVRLINQMGYKAVGLSGKDGQTVIASKRLHQREENGQTIEVDLGQVGDVAEVHPDFIQLLLSHDYIPVMTCLASDEAGNDYNINGDLFAGHIAGALNARQYIVLTDVDGLLEQKDDPSTLIKTIDLPGLAELMDKEVIQGGMIPKVDSCRVALEKGAQSARIINGTAPSQISAIIQKHPIGTAITK
jgi:acetylglutamate kinase